MANLLLTLDPARQTGWCLAEPFTGMPSMTCGSWMLPAGAVIQERIVILSRHLSRLLDEHTVVMVGVEIPNQNIRTADVIEEGPMGPEKKRKAFGSSKSIAQLYGYHGAVIGIVGALGTPLRWEGPRTWRSIVWPGAGNMKKEAAKLKCRDFCHRLGIHATNDDQRTAAAMMVWLNKEYRQHRALEESLARRAA